MEKTSSWIFGIIFIIVGILGFIQSSVLGIFAADTLSSIVHIIVGVILLAMASKRAAVGTLKTVGVVYIIFAILGFISGSTMLGLFVVNGAANWLDLVLGVVMALLGWSSAKTSMSTPPPSALQM